MVGLFFLMLQSAVGSLLTSWGTRASSRVFHKELPAFAAVYKGCFIAMIGGSLATNYFVNLDDMKHEPLRGAALFLVLLWCAHAVVFRIFLGLRGLEMLVLPLVPVGLWVVILGVVSVAFALIEAFV